MAEIKIAPHYKVMQRLIDKGFEAYLVGGSVRDGVLGRDSKDYDVTTDALPEQVAAIFVHTIPVGAKFGVTVVVVDGMQIEVATYRADGAYTDGRRPDEVKYSLSAKEDVVRRDFTMNGLLRDSNGDIVDHVGGLDDIKRKLIRAIGDPNVRFAEDALRMLRAVRFAAQLGFEIESKTLEAITANARLLSAVSRERVAMELFKMFSAPYPLQGLMPFITTGLYRFALPEGFVRHANMTYMIQRFGTFSANKDSMLGMAMFFADLDAALVDHLGEYLKLSNEQTDELEHMHAHVDMFKRHIFGIGSVSEAELKRWCRQPGVALALEIMTQDEVMGKSNFGIEALMDFVLKIKAYKPEEIKPVLLITGKDLIAEGIPPGPIFSSVLYDVETQQLNGTMTTREQAIAYVRSRVYQDETMAWVYTGVTSEWQETE